MNKTVLLAATAVLALTAGYAPARPTLVVKSAYVVRVTSPARPLYSQNSNYDTHSILSQNFSSTMGQSNDCAGADDFLIPKGKLWTIRGIDVAGVYYNGSGPAQSEVVTFYADRKGKPGTAIGKGQTVKCTDSAGSFACKLKTVALDNRAGTKKMRVWVSVVANLNFTSGGDWGWTAVTQDKNDPGKWENPGGELGTRCPTWKDTSICIPYGPPANDYAFAVLGKSSSAE